MRSPAARQVLRNALLRRRRFGAAGQSLAEFAIVLPILLAVFGAALDYSRFNEQRVKLESATRDAAEWAATDATVTSQAQAVAAATRVVCRQFDQPDNCTSPAVLATWFSDPRSPGTAAYPQVTVEVTTSLPFQTFLPYPFLTDGGAVTLTASAKFSVLQGR